MNYKKLYNNLIEKAKSRGVFSGYYETHHILPSSLGGDNTEENKVKLTAKEHFVAHHLLWKIHRCSKTAMAFFCMTRKNPGRSKETYYTSRMYESAKLAMSESKSGENNFWYGTTGPMYGKKHTEKFKKSHKERMKKASEYKKGKPKSEILGLSDKCNFVKDQVAWNTGVTGKDSHLYGKPKSEEAKMNMKRSWFQRPIIVCPHCGKESKNMSPMSRFHFDNCKFKKSTTS